VSADGIVWTPDQVRGDKEVDLVLFADPLPGVAGTLLR